MPHNLFMNTSKILRKKFYQLHVTHISIASEYLLFKFDELYISKGVFPIPYTISYTIVCGVSQFNPYNKGEINNSIIAIISTT